MLPLTCVLTRSMSRTLSGSLMRKDFEHLPEKNTFKMLINESDFGVVEYKKNLDVYDLFHSFVPAHLNGRGYGHVLAKKTFDYIAEKNYRMSITCPFLLRCYKENEEKYKKYFVD